MGLDMYVFKMQKIKDLGFEVKTRNWYRDNDYSVIPKEDFEEYPELYEDLKPYMLARDVLMEFYDMDKIAADNNIDLNEYQGRVGGWSNDKSTFYFHPNNRNNNTIRIEIDSELIKDKYTKTETVKSYIYKSTEEMYWRKEYDLQDLFHDLIPKPVDNCGYYKLDEDIVDGINEYLKDNGMDKIMYSDGLFYWEWY